MALGRSLHAGAWLLMLVVAAVIGESTIHSRSRSLLFLASAALGTYAGFRVAGGAFRWGRRRRGQDPEPGQGSAAALGRFLGFWVKLLLGFVVWALLVQFFKRM